MQRIEALAHEIEVIQDDIRLPVVLQRLSGVLQGSPSLLQLQAVWEQGLLYVMVDCLQMDYNRVQGGWETAAGVAGLLSTCCRGAPPETFSSLAVPHKMLALVWKVTTKLSKGHHAVYGMTQRRILEALLGVCEAHPQVFAETWSDPVLTTILLTEDALFRRNTISFLRQLLDMQRHAVDALSPEACSNISQELAFNIVKTDDPAVAEDAVRTVLRLALSRDAIVRDLASYSGLDIALAKWASYPFWGFVKQLIDAMNAARLRDATETPEKRRERAAVTLQSAWRGTSARQRIECLNRARLFLANIDGRREAAKEECLREEQARRERQQDRLRRKEAMKAFIQSKPADEVAPLLRARQDQAATTIQCAWRSHQSRAHVQTLRVKQATLKAAITIQSFFRGYRVRRQVSQQKLSRPFPLPAFPTGIDDTRRIELQKEIAEFRELHGRKGVAFSEVEELHKEAHGLLLEHVQRQRRRDRRLQEEREALLARLQLDAHGLRDAPALGKVPGASEVVPFLSSVPDIVREARRRHGDAIREAKSPWWRAIEEANQKAVPVQNLFFRAAPQDDTQSA